MSLKSARVFLAALVALMLVAQPVLAAPSRALGNVVYSQRAWLGSAQARPGATIFAGDQMTTEVEGILRLRIGDGQLYLLASSAATVEQGDGTLDAQLERGAVGFAATPASPIVVRSGELLVRAKNGAAHGRVEKHGANEFVVSSYSGELVVTNGSESYSVAPNSSYRVTMDRDVYPEQEPQDPAGAGAGAARRHHMAMMWLGAALSATIITFVVLQNLSPKLP